MPKKVRKLVENEGVISKRDWECSLLTAIRDEIRVGNVAAQSSKRFGRFDNFFISDDLWAARRDAFFTRAGLPISPEEASVYLTNRLNLAYDNFLANLPENTYASVNENGWTLSYDRAEKLNKETEEKLDNLTLWLDDNLRQIKLPELLIEVDNELHFTHPFLSPAQPIVRDAESVCHIIATIMAHGCLIGPYTMARLTNGITYHQIKRITDWQLSEEAQRQALAQLVNAISHLGVTNYWGKGKTSSSDGQRDFVINRRCCNKHGVQDFKIMHSSFILLWQTTTPHFTAYLLNVLIETLLMSWMAFYTMKATLL